MNSRLSMLAVVSLAIMACNHGVAIIATNESGADKQVHVTFPETIKLSPRRDSLQAWDLTNTQDAISSRDRYRYSLKIPANVDTSRNTLSFNLKTHHEATVLGQPTSLRMIQKTLFIVGTNTLKYKRRGGCWTFTIR